MKILPSIFYLVLSLFLLQGNQSSAQHIPNAVDSINSQESLEMFANYLLSRSNTYLKYIGSVHSVVTHDQRYDANHNK